MTPHQADVALVLEQVAGVRGLYAIQPGRRAAASFDFAVEIERDGRVLAAVHYELLRVMTHDDCARVFLFHEEAPRVVAEGAHPLRLTDSEREAARRRVPATPPRTEPIVRPDARAHVPDVLVVDDDPDVLRIVREAIDASSRWAVFPEIEAAVKAVAPEKARRRLTHPPSPAPFSVLLADVDDDVHEALRAMFHHDARHVMRGHPEESAEMALSTPFHVIVCSAKAALHPRSILDGIAREDPEGADRVLVVAPARDVPYVKHKIDQMGRRNRVLSLPIDEALLRREIFGDHPTLAARVAVADVADAAPPAIARLRFRRLAVLVVDDDQTTHILFAAGEPGQAGTEADVALATTPMEAFEHVMSRAVDVLVVSATMRGDGGEPFYRVLWRLKPELKSRCVLVTPPDALPPSAPRSHPPRIVERPLSRDAIGRIVKAFARAPAR
jgi:CheY-like chemotaxis protein